MAAAVALYWWPLAPWLSPAAAWFVFFNAVVAAIAVMSCGSHDDAGGPAAAAAAGRRRLGRSGSSLVLDRLRSFYIFAAHPAAAGVAVAPVDDGDGTSVSASSDPHCYYCCCSRGAEEAAAAQELPEQPVAAPAAGTAPSSANSPIAPATPAPAPENQEDKAEAEEEQGEHEAKKEAEAEEKQVESISLDEAYALALSQRLRAQELASPPSPPPAPATAAATATPAARTKKPAKKAAEGISRRRTKAEEAPGGKAELNARAELFIRQFREDLRLQRINSILSHTHALRSPTAAR